MVQTKTRDSKVKISKHALFKKTDAGPAFVVNLKTGLYYNMNETGERIWLAIKEGKRPRDIAKSLAKRFQIKTEKALSEVSRYLEKLEKEKLVIVGRTART